jgi:DNA-binding NarL/FixJ family response regulator
MPLRCLVVEDEVMFSQMLAGLLRGITGLEVVGIARTCADAISACDDLRPDLLILDLALPDGNGVDVARHLAASNQAARSIVLSGQASTFVVPADLPAEHVHGVVDKTKAYSVLQREVLQLVATESEAGSPADPAAALSARESEVFRELGRGQTNKQIAERLGISPATVALHRKRVASKLNARGPELVRLATLHHRADA